MGDTHRPKRVIVNADDFGFSEGVTEGILRAHRAGIVTSTTLAANMPAAASAVARLGEAPGLGVGVHLNVCQGPPLSAAGRELAGDDGVMRRTAGQLLAACLLRPRLLAAVEAEAEAQVRWALDHGVRPTHLDSHRHVHGFWPIFVRVVGLARRYHIPFVRRHREVLSGPGWPAAEAKQRRIAVLTNLFGARNALVAPALQPTRGTWGVAHTGRIDAAWLVRAARAVRPGVTEIMTHPGLADDLAPAATRLLASRRKELAALCDPAVREAFARRGIELTHYGRI
ncbi:MAG TPA: ChbG/HpnK family deacetylase [Phycisphaerae bacterium]|nr:ChbG/HpnK family deacetylase [Phycisphaerae bacterium]